VDQQAVARLQAQGLVIQEGTRLRTTGAGMLLLDAILAEVVRA
jgi:coproporphyrinogen III oxidase-like Fe-S oxidoreductase